MLDWLNWPTGPPLGLHHRNETPPTLGANDMLNFDLNLFKKMPAFAELLQQHEDGQLAERQAQIDALRAFRADDAAEQAHLAAEVQRIDAERQQIRARLAQLNAEHGTANSAAIWHANGATRKARDMEAAILAGADPNLLRFRAWADRAGNLARISTAGLGYVAGDAPRITHANQREAVRLCAEAVTRADEMRLEAISADDVALELDAIAAGILDALDRAGGSARLPRDWRHPLI